MAADTTGSCRSPVALSLSVLVCLVWLTIPPAHALAVGASLCGPGLRDIRIPDQCFPPDKAAVARARMQAGSVPPRQVVWRATGLRLNQVELRLAARPIEIDYLYGRVPVDAHHGGIADLGSKQFRYVIVGEQLWRLSPGARREYSVPTFVNTNLMVGYWVFQANFPCGPYSLMVTSNGPRHWVTDIGRRLLQTQACGK